MKITKKEKGNIMSNLIKVLSFSLILLLLGSASIFVYETEKTIPSTMPASTILTYGDQLNPGITVDQQMQKSRITNGERDISSAEDLVAEEAVYQKI